MQRENACRGLELLKGVLMGVGWRVKSKLVSDSILPLNGIHRLTSSDLGILPVRSRCF